MATALPISGVNHIARETENVERSLAFYRDVLGFRQVWRPQFQFPGAWLYNYGVMIHVIQGHPSTREKEIRTRTDHVAFHTDDIDAAEAALKERGIEYRSSVVPQTGVKQLFLLDPDGNHIEIGTYPPVRELPSAT